MGLFGMNRRDFLKTSGLISATGGIFSGMTGREILQANGVEPGEPLETPTFLAAKPVWAKGRETEMNVELTFRAQINLAETDGVILRSTGSTIMKIFVNGNVAGYGPARGPHGWFRVDEWNLTPFLIEGVNRIEIVVAGYNSNSYYLLDQPSFLQAEILDGAGRLLAMTGPDAQGASDPVTGTAEEPTRFLAMETTGIRLQKVQRFSFQRPFIEVYRFPGAPERVELAEQPEISLLPRRVPYPEFDLLEPTGWGKRGTVVRKEKLEKPWRDRSLVNIGPELKGYPLEELEIVLSDEIQRLETTFDENAKPLDFGSTYHAQDAQVVDFGANYSGFIGLELEAIEPGTVIAVTFDEILAENGDVNFLRLGTCSAIQWTFQKEENVARIEAFEPEVARYAKIHCLAGSFKLRKIFIREYAYPKITEADFSSSDPRLDKLFRAGVLTYRENAVDAFTDCPHRERAGWLCDSFFTARTAFDLTGKTDVEQTFFENYLLPEKFAHLPDGMLPMCYPADHNDGVFIPNWALWFVMELKEYARRGVDQSTIKELKTKVEKLMTFFAGYENADGLLEKLPSWVFVEWSAANRFVQDVNYPSNMLYAAALEAAGNLYQVPEWTQKAEKIRQTIIAQSFDGEFFVDNAIRKPDGSLEITRNRSEVCQYFAFFFETATPESHPELWKKLLDEFGPHRVKEGKYPEIHKANSFVGNVVRLELLSMASRGEQLLEESVAYNEYMADRTGTLWENDTDYASCNHGFASHICHVFFRDILGIANVDVPTRTITFLFQKFEKLDWADGVQPVPGGVISLHWEKKGNKLLYHYLIPSGWTLKGIENRSGLELTESWPQR